MKKRPAPLVHEQEIIAISNKNPREEVCGLLLRSSALNTSFTVKQLPNLSSDRQSTFLMDAIEFAQFVTSGQAWGTWHAHPGPMDVDGPSEADLHISNVWELPGCVYVRHSGLFHYWKPDGYKMPLIGRPYCPTIFDCYSAVRDALQELIGFEMQDLDRRLLSPSGALPDHPKIWGGWGYEWVLQPKPGRIAMMDFMGAMRVNHIGLLLSNSELFHQLRDQRSRIDYFGNDWRQLCHGFLRHPGIEVAMKAKNLDHLSLI